MKIKKENELVSLRRRFLYDYLGRPDVYQFGAFKDGLTAEEIDDYLKVRSNSLKIIKIRKKFDDLLCGSTCRSIAIQGEKVVVEKCLIYRHDVERFANNIFEKTPTYFD